MTKLKKRKATKPAQKTAALHQLALSIKHEHNLAQSALESGAEHAAAAGQYLTDAKSQMKHGRFLAWVAENTGIADSTARWYMQVAREWPTIQANRQRINDWSQSGIRRFLAQRKKDEKAAALAKAAEAAGFESVEEYADTIRAVEEEINQPDPDEMEAAIVQRLNALMTEHHIQATVEDMLAALHALGITDEYLYQQATRP